MQHHKHPELKRHVALYTEILAFKFKIKYY